MREVAYANLVTSALEFRSLVTDLRRDRVAVRQSHGLNGVVFAQGGTYGGWSVFTKDNNLKYCYNVLGIETFTVASDTR